MPTQSRGHGTHGTRRTSTRTGEWPRAGRPGLCASYRPPIAPCVQVHRTQYTAQVWFHHDRVSPREMAVVCIVALRARLRKVSTCTSETVALCAVNNKRAHPFFRSTMVKRSRHGYTLPLNHSRPRRPTESVHAPPRKLPPRHARHPLHRRCRQRNVVLSGSRQPPQRGWQDAEAARSLCHPSEERGRRSARWRTVHSGAATERGR